MTVSYSDRSFVRLLFRWRGSIWKAVWKNLLIFMICYYSLNLSYRFAMTDSQQTQFEHLVVFVDTWLSKMPIQFLLGFYVNFIVSRWWDQWNAVVFPDKFLLFLTSCIPGRDETSRMIRRTIARYCNLHAILVWREVSVKIKKRFPKDDHLLRSGLITEKEYDIYSRTTSVHGRWFVPISWVASLLARARTEKFITDVQQMSLLNELYSIRGSNGMLTVYDWINAPLVYTHVATLVTYGYFAMALLGRQCLDTTRVAAPGFEIDIYFPIFTVLELVFYIGWLKVAEEYRVPFGEDDDDFELNYILDRNIHVSNMLVDELAQQSTTLVKDKWWDVPSPMLPHTVASYKVRDRVPNFRLNKKKIKDKDTLYHSSFAEIVEEKVEDMKRELGEQLLDFDNKA